MRIARTLFVSAAITASAALCAPAANAVTATEPWTPVNATSFGSDDHDKFKDGKEKFKDEHDKKDHFGKEKPKGGVHAGGGGLATSGGSMTAGSVLLLGGLGAGAYMLRRRNASDAAA